MIDMDGVCANFLAGYNDIQRELGKITTPWEAPWDAFWDNDVWAIIKKSPTYWARLPNLLSEVELAGLRGLEMRHDLYFVTARMGIRPKQQTEEWLYARAFLNPTVIICADGSGGADKKLYLSYGIGADFSIDDRLLNVERIAKNENLVSYLKETPQNTNDVWSPRVKTFLEFLEMIEVEEDK